MTRDEIISQEMESIKKEIIERYEALGMRASGQFATETTIEDRGKKHFVVAPAYASQLIKGRKPGTMPPVKAIEQWIRDKGIAARASSDISVTSLAYLIARKIQREGTTYFKQGGTDLLESVITPERMQRIIDRLKDFTIVDIQNRISRELKAIAA